MGGSRWWNVSARAGRFARAQHTHHGLAHPGWWYVTDVMHTGDFGFRTPTSAEFRFATTTAILGGARGIGMWVAYRCNMTWATATLPPLLRELNEVARAVVAADKALGADSVVVPDPSLVISATTRATASVKDTALVVAALYQSNRRNTTRGDPSNVALLVAARVETASTNATVRFGGPKLRGFLLAQRVHCGAVQSTHRVIAGEFTDHMDGLDTAIYHLKTDDDPELQPPPAPTRPAIGNSSDDVVIGGGGYPRGVQLLSGVRLVCVGMDIYSSPPSPSSDGLSAKWSKISTVLTDSRPGVDLANCNLAQLPSGRVLASCGLPMPCIGPIACEHRLNYGLTELCLLDLHATI